MKTIQQQKIDRLKKDIEWYRLYANYVESHFSILGDKACDYADNKIKEETEKGLSQLIEISKTRFLT